MVYKKKAANKVVVAKAPKSLVLLTMINHRKAAKSPCQYCAFGPSIILQKARYCHIGIG